MPNDSIETLLLHHYGPGAPTPPLLEQQLVSSVRHEVAVRYQQERTAANIRAYRINRRRVLKLVAMGSAGISVLGASLDILSGTNNTRSALS